MNYKSFKNKIYMQTLETITYMHGYELQFFKVVSSIQIASTNLSIEFSQFARLYLNTLVTELKY